MKNPIELVRSFFADVGSIKREIQFVGSAMSSLLHTRTEGTYVLVLPPGGARMLGQMHHVPPGKTMQVSFNSPLPVPKGSWVVTKQYLQWLRHLKLHTHSLSDGDRGNWVLRKITIVPKSGITVSNKAIPSGS